MAEAQGTLQKQTLVKYPSKFKVPEDYDFSTRGTFKPELKI